MKTLNILKTIILASIIILSSCTKSEVNGEEEAKPNKEETKPNKEETNNNLIPKNGETTEGSGSYTYTDVLANITENRNTFDRIWASYYDVSDRLKNTEYAYFTYMESITNPSQSILNQEITFVFLGNSYPKSGTYKIGDYLKASYGPNETYEKLLADEVAVSATNYISHRDNTVTLKVVNENGKITITSNGEIKLYESNTGRLRSVVKNINLVRTTKKWQIK